MKKYLSMLMICMMLLGILSGCGNEQKKFVGTWEADFDVAQIINDEMTATAADMAEYLSIPEFSVKVQMTFYEDGTYKMGVNEEALLESFDGMLDVIGDGMMAYLDDAAAEMGFTADEMLEMAGVSLETLMEEAFSDEMLDEMLDELTAEMNMEGDFKVKDGYLYMSDGKGADMEYGEKYEIDAKELILYGNKEMADEEFVPGISYPISFVRIA